MNKALLRSVSIDDRLERCGFSIDTYSSVGTYPKGHYHQGVEILLVHWGSVHVSMERWKGLAHAGQAVVLSGMHHHVVRPIDHHFVRTAIHFAPHMLTHDEAAQFAHSIVQSEGGKVLSLSGAVANRLFWAAEELENLWAHEQGSTNTARYLMTLVVGELAQADMLADGDAGDVSIVTVLYYMRNHLDRNETVEEVAARFFLSERQLYRLFQEQLHCSPKQYWLRLRMEKAASLLKNTSSTTAEISAAVGFSSVSGFERAFKRVMGLTTSEYRGKPAE